MNRRDILKSTVAAAVSARIAVSRGMIWHGGAASASSPQAFDLYISPTGSDANLGTLASPWSASAINSKQSTYAGKRVGFLPGTYQTVSTGGSLYALLQGVPNNYTPALQIQGGTIGTPTYFGSSDSSGNYSPRTATLDFSNPSGGALPTAEGCAIGQGGNTLPSNVGNWIWDGINITNCTYSFLTIRGGTTNVPNVTIQNSEFSNATNVSSANNPGAIYVYYQATNLQILNNKFSNLQTTSGGNFPWGYPAIGINGGAGPTISTVTIKNNTALTVGKFLEVKIGQVTGSIQYNYCEVGTFGAGSSGQTAGIWFLDVPSGQTMDIDHNIWVGYGAYLIGATSNSTSGTINYLHNTHYASPSGSGYVGCLVDGAAGSTFNHESNLYWSDETTSPQYNYGYLGGTLVVVNGTGISGSNCNFNCYGSNGNAAQFSKTLYSGNFPWSTWQADGYDPNSIRVGTTPFSGTPMSGSPSSFAVSSSSAAYTAGVSGSIAGALDGTGPIGSNF